MLLFIIFFIPAIICSVLGFVWRDEPYCSTKKDIQETCIISDVFLWFIVVIMLLISLFNHINLEGRIAEQQETYESLIYQLENNLYDNDNDLGKKDLYNQITEWNKNVVWYKSMQDNIWLGMFYANIWTDLEPIELGG